jgi:hypothetical protein
MALLEGLDQIVASDWLTEKWGQKYGRPRISFLNRPSVTFLSDSAFESMTKKWLDRKIAAQCYNSIFLPTSFCQFEGIESQIASVAMDLPQPR